jgi:hypothetical protein
MDMAYYVWAEPYAMIVPRPGEKSRLLAFVYPFDILVIITLFFYIFLMLLNCKILIPVNFHNFIFGFPCKGVGTDFYYDECNGGLDDPFFNNLLQILNLWS